MDDPKYIVSQLIRAQEHERQFERDIERLKREKPQNSAAISQKTGYLNEVRREISRLQSQLR